MANLARQHPPTDSEPAGSAEDAIAACRNAVAANPEAREARRELAELLRRAGRWEDLVAALSNELQRACTTSEARYAVLIDLGTVYHRHLDRTFMAVDAAKRALESDPSRLEASDLLIEVYFDKQRWADLLPLLERRLELTTDSAVRIAILERIADVTLKRTGGSRQAVNVYERMLAESPGHPMAVQALEELHHRNGDWEKLVLLKQEHALAGCQGEERLYMALELATLAHSKLKRIDVELALWRVVRDLDPRRPEALEALDPILRRKGEWSELAQVLDARLELVLDPKLRAQLLQRSAMLYEDQLQDQPTARERAIERWSELLQQDPGHHRARNALRDMYLNQRDFEGFDALYADQGARVYAMTLEQVLRDDDVPMRAALLRRLARLYRDDLRQERKALTTLEALATLDPNDAQTIRSLVELYEEVDDKRKLARALEQLGELTEDVAERSTLLARAAGLYEYGVRAPDAALRCWLQAVAVNPGIPGFAEEAERLAATCGRWQQLVSAYQDALEQLPEELRVDKLAIIARAQEQELHDLDAAAATYEALLDLDPTHARGSEGLARVLLAQGRYEALFDHYARKLKREPGGGAEGTSIVERLSIYYEVADLLEDRLSRPVETLEILGRALREAPDNRDTLVRLDALAARHGLWQELLVLYRQMTSQPLPPRAQVELRCRVGQLYAERFENPARALRAFRRVLDLDPRNATAVEAIRRLEA